MQNSCLYNLHVIKTICNNAYNTLSTMIRILYEFSNFLVIDA